MPDTIDVTDLIGPPRKVKISNSLTLLFPADLPVETYLTILHLQDKPEELEDQSVVQSLRDDVIELLQVHQPETTRLPPAVSIPVLIQLIGRVYRQDPTPAAAAKPRAKAKPRASRGTSTTTKPRRRSTSGS